MRRYAVVLIDTNGRVVRRNTVEAKSFKGALGLVVPNPKDYVLMQPTGKKLKQYESRKYFANVSLL